jgi:hypothetical protein
VEAVSQAKANVLRHSGVSADEVAERLFGANAILLSQALEDPARAPALLPLFAPDGLIFRASQLLTAERRLEALATLFAAVPADIEVLWRVRRELCVLEALSSPVLANEMRGLRSLVDGLIELCAAWRMSAESHAAAARVSHRGDARAASAVFLSRLRAPEARLLDLLLDGLPYVLGFLRDRSVVAALEPLPIETALRHLTVLHDALWELVHKGSATEPASSEQMRALDEAIETVFAQIRRAEDATAQLATLAALYRLVLCVRTAAVGELVRRGLHAAGKAAAEALADLGVRGLR